MRPKRAMPAFVSWSALAIILMLAACGDAPVAEQSRLSSAPLPRTLTSENAEEDLFQGMAHLFTIPDYFDYGLFEPQECTELPGKLFRARAKGAACSSAFLISGKDHWYAGKTNDLRFEADRLYAAWRVQRPERLAPGGKYSYVFPKGGSVGDLDGG